MLEMYLENIVCQLLENMSLVINGVNLSTVPFPETSFKVVCVNLSVKISDWNFTVPSISLVVVDSSLTLVSLVWYQPA